MPECIDGSAGQFPLPRIYIGDKAITAEPQAPNPAANYPSPNPRGQLYRPRMAEFQVKEAKIGNLSIPQALIPRLVHQIVPPMGSSQFAPDGMPLKTPEYIGDVRVSNGKITLYKTATVP